MTVSLFVWWDTKLGEKEGSPYKTMRVGRKESAEPLCGQTFDDIL